MVKHFYAKSVQLAFTVWEFSGGIFRH